VISAVFLLIKHLGPITGQVLTAELL